MPRRILAVAALSAVLVLSVLVARSQGAPSQGAPSQGAPSQGAPSQGAVSSGAVSSGLVSQGVASQAARLPSTNAWLHDTVTALAGARPYVARRAARGGGKLALNLDIDNTSVATTYAPGRAVPATLRLARYARSKGIHVLFSTGRNVRLRQRTIAELRRAGFPVDGLCAHYRGESLRHGKQRCRRSFVHNGFTIVANIGNRRTDLAGKNYERAYRLPSYGNRLD